MRKEFSKLTFTDDYMFAKVMLNKVVCIKLLELILDIKISDISYPLEQKVINPSYSSKSVRLDVYVDDADGTVFDLEMQTSALKNIPLRTRYYQGMIDMDLIEKGEDYAMLRKSYVIFICTDDILGLGKPVYRFESYCKEHDVSLGDKAYKIILNASSRDIDGSPLGNFLRFVRTGEATDDFTRRLQCEVTSVKSNHEWEVEYMTLLMRDKENIKIGSSKRLVSVVESTMTELNISLERACEIAHVTLDEYNEAVELARENCD